MHPLLTPLAPALLNALGTYGSLHDWLTLPGVSAALLKTLPSSPPDLSAQPVPLQVEGAGWVLLLQCLNPQVQAPDHQWGVHGITLERSYPGPWPHGLTPRQTTPEQLTESFTRAARHQDPQALDDVLSQPGWVSMTVTGPKGEPWGLLATFDERTGLLDTFSLLRTAPWRRWQALPEPAATPAGPAEAEPLPSADAPTCRTGQKAPRAGLWEARLPIDHPLAANLHASSHRFVFARGGDPLPTVGLQPFDENMVVWIWRRER